MIIIQRFGTYPAANHAMSGGIIGGAPTDKMFEGLVGKTITFTSPAGSKTFTQPAGTNLGQLKFSDVKAQLEGAIANLKVLSIDNKLAFGHATAGSSVTLGAVDEPARVILGLPNKEAIAGRFLNAPSGTAPRFLEHVTENGAVSIAIEV